MSTNTSSLNCSSFVSINDFLAQAEAGQLNISQTVAECSNICSLAWGYGNPDLSGIGINASYIIQTVLVFIFGPIFIFVYGGSSSKRRKQLKEAYLSFLDISAQFTIPVAAASLVRFKQSAPFYEITFLQSLMTTQFLGLLSTIFSSVWMALCEDEDKGKGLFSRGRIFIIVIYGLVDFSLYMALVAYLRTSKASWTSLQELAASCIAYGSLLPGYVYIQHSNPHAPTLTLPKLQNITTIDGVQILNSAQEKTSWRNTGIVIGLMLACVVGIFLLLYLLARCSESIETVIVGILAAIAATIGLPIFVASYVATPAFAIAAIYCLTQLERKRNTMKAITGSEFQDNYWGFAQVVSIFLWFPLIFQMIHWFFWADDDDETALTATGDTEKGKAVSAASDSAAKIDPVQKPKTSESSSQAKASNAKANNAKPNNVKPDNVKTDKTKAKEAKASEAQPSTSPEIQPC